jgi:hypothetical protein
MAAEKVGRRGFGIEYDPAYVDVSIRRWQQYTRADAVLLGDGRTFEDVEAERIAGAASSPDSATERLELRGRGDGPTITDNEQ